MADQKIEIEPSGCMLGALMLITVALAGIGAGLGRIATAIEALAK